MPKKKKTKTGWSTRAGSVCAPLELDSNDHVWISLPGAKEERSDAAKPAHFWIYSATLIPEMVTPITLLLCSRGLCTHGRSLFISSQNQIYMLRLTMTRIILLMYTCKLPPFSLSLSLYLFLSDTDWVLP